MDPTTRCLVGLEQSRGLEEDVVSKTALGNMFHKGEDKVELSAVSS